MNQTDIARYRQVSQLLTVSGLKTVKELVGWMGALQAQDYPMVKWAIGVRLPGSTNALVEDSINRGEIIRTHLMRPTWHLVSADDIYWMLELTAPQIRKSLLARHKALEITESVLAKSISLLETNLSGGNHLTREELVSLFGRASIANHDNRISHLLLSAELDGLICSGITKKGKPTYALLKERVPGQITRDRSEALAKLALKYFASHGPAKVHDFTWWSGLTAGDARKAHEMIRHELEPVTVGDDQYWLAGSLPALNSHETSVHLLPAYDEFIISYKDRNASLSVSHGRKAVSSNGIFHPVILVDGQVIGLWKRTLSNNKIVVTADFFKKPDKTIGKKIEMAVQAYVDFVGQ
jgi:hypothetical protein